MTGRLRYAQVALGLFGDAKVRRLFRSIGEERDGYAAMGLWLDLLLESWQAEERESWQDTFGQHAYEDLREALQSAGLLDAEGRVPSGAWDKWWGPIERERERTRDSKRRQREMSTGTGRDIPGQAGNDRESRPVFPSIPFPSTSEEERESEREEGPGDQSPGLDVTYYDLTARVMSPRQLSWARSLEEQYGMTTAIETMKRTMQKTGDPDRLLADTSDALKLLANAATRRQEVERAQRQEEARRDRTRRQMRELRAPEATADPRPLRELMPDVAHLLGKEGTK